MPRPKLHKTVHRLTKLERYILSGDNVQEQERQSPQTVKSQYGPQDQLAAEHSKTERELSSIYPSSTTALKNWRPFYVSCFSPLDLPADVFKYFLLFLTAGDLWKLVQVSKAMQEAVSKYMWEAQRVGYDIARVLRQENPYSRSEWHRLSHERRYERTMERHWAMYSSVLWIAIPPPLPESPTFEEAFLTQNSSNFVTSRDAPLGRGDIRSQYWSAQGEALITALTAGTPYADAAPSLGEASVIAHEESDELDAHDDLEEESELEEWNPENSPSPSLASAGDVTRVKSISLIIQSTAGNHPPLPIERFWFMVDVLFDPNLVQLDHRRAIINCTRYTASAIETAFGSAVSTALPFNSESARKMRLECRVTLAPYLKVVQPGSGEVEWLSRTKDRPVIALPYVLSPSRLATIFHWMLWHRCLSDLVVLYERIQGQHTRPALISSKTVHHSPTRYSTREEKWVGRSCSQHQRQDVEPGYDGIPELSAYPFCCSRHSSRFSKQRLSRLSPYITPSRISGTCQTIQGVSTTTITTTKTEAPDDGSWPYHGDCNKRFSRAGRRSARDGCVTADSAALREQAHQQERQRQHDAQEEDLCHRRSRMEERARQDTMIKEELLYLCHMACGLFMIRDDSIPAEAEPLMTIMTLLRKGSPWNTGVWREGEWRHAPIDMDHDTDEVLMAYRLALEDERARERQSGMRNRSARNLSSGCHGREGIDDVADRGPWQKLCLATIQFLAHENLEWAGRVTDPELSRLRATNHDGAWHYHE